MLLFILFLVMVRRYPYTSNYREVANKAFHVSDFIEVISPQEVGSCMGRWRIRKINHKVCQHRLKAVENEKLVTTLKTY